jgi:hypothetical protein
MTGMNIVKLNVGERLSLLSILPEKANFAELKIVREVRESLSLTELEHDKQNFRTGDEDKQENPALWYWDDNKVFYDIEFGARALDIAAEALKALDKAGEISNNTFSLYEKIVEATKED